MNKPIVRIKNWKIMTHPFYGNPVVHGDVVGHPRLGSLRHVYTSTIEKIMKTKNMIETRNTLYKLSGKGECILPEEYGGLIDG
jgi:hypothetical protein